MKEQLHLYLPAQLRKALDAGASKTDRSAAAYARVAIREALERDGVVLEAVARPA